MQCRISSNRVHVLPGGVNCGENVYLLRCDSERSDGGRCMCDKGFLVVSTEGREKRTLTPYGMYCIHLGGLGLCSIRLLVYFRGNEVDRLRVDDTNNDRGKLLLTFLYVEV